MPEKLTSTQLNVKCGYGFNLFCQRCREKFKKETELSVMEAGDTFREFGHVLCLACASDGRLAGRGHKLIEESPPDTDRRLSVLRHYRDLFDRSKSVHAVNAWIESSILDKEVGAIDTKLIEELARTRKLEIEEGL